jgi:hypothetical protein
MKEMTSSTAPRPTSALTLEDSARPTLDSILHFAAA